MHCRNCGGAVLPEAIACVTCGAAPRAGNKFCSGCGSATDPSAVFCVKCGMATANSAGAGMAGAVGGELKSKITAALLAIFVGGLGIHRFYLGYTTIGVIQICVTLVLGFLTCGIGALAGSIWGLVEGILILTGSINKDAQGRPLRD